MTAVEEVRTRQNAARPRAAHVLERAKIGRQRGDALSEIGRLQQRIIEARAVSLEDTAVQLRRLVVMEEPGMRGLTASVLVVVEREAGAAYGPNLKAVNPSPPRRPNLLPFSDTRGATWQNPNHVTVTAQASRARSMCTWAHGCANAGSCSG